MELWSRVKKKDGDIHPNSIAFGSAPQREADSQPINQLVRQAVRQTISQASRRVDRNTKHTVWVFSVTHKHLRVTTHVYYSATTCAHAMKHLRDLQSMYDNAIRSKRDYHEVVDARLQDEISITRFH